MGHGIKQAFCITAILALLSGCSSEEEHAAGSTDSSPDQAAVQANPITDVVWAQAILKASADWDTVTPDPVLADPAAFVDCSAPLRSPTGPPSPHNPGSGYNIGTFSDQSGPNAFNMNQFAVNAIAQPYFELVPVDTWPGNIPDAYPIGTTIVKEKYSDINEANRRGLADAVAVMVKRELGYDPEHGDWEYAYIDLDRESQIKSVTRGKIAGCIDCHSNRSTSDYVFRDYLIIR